MSSERFITENQRHFGIKSGIVSDDELGLAACFGFSDARKLEAHFLPFGRNQNVEVFDVLRRLQVERSARFLLQQLAGSFQQTSPWRNRVALKMHLLHGVRGIAAQPRRKAGFGFLGGIYDEEVVQKVHGYKFIPIL